MTNVLHIIDSLDPATGGTATGLIAIAPYLHEEGFSSRVCTWNGAGQETPFLKNIIYAGKPFTPWSYSSSMRSTLAKEIRAADVVIIHGLWKYQSVPARALCQKYQKPYFVYTHGMLDPWFNEQYFWKKLKKLATWRWNEYPLLRDAQGTIFTSGVEAERARRSFSPYQTRECILPYGTTPLPEVSSEEITSFRAQHDLSEKPFFLFLGRIHAKKNLCATLLAYEASNACLSHDFVIAGNPSTPADETRLAQTLASLSPASRKGVRVVGSLYGKDKAVAFRGADAFVLFSHQENFGLAVAEALSAGTPVLLSHAINIYEIIEQEKAGLSTGVKEKDITPLFREWLSLSASQKDAYRQSAKSCFTKHFHVQQAATALATLLSETCSQRQ